MVCVTNEEMKDIEDSVFLRGLFSSSFLPDSHSPLTSNAQGSSSPPFCLENPNLSLTASVT
jgi:hypothetical protein